jgi:hypothetical protein
MDDEAHITYAKKAKMNWEVFRGADMFSGVEKNLHQLQPHEKGRPTRV